MSDHLPPDTSFSALAVPDDEPVVGPSPVQHRIPRWPFVLAGALLLLGVALAVAMSVRVPYVALSPGPVENVSTFLETTQESFTSEGDFYLLTVAPREVTALQYVEALFDKETDLAPREIIRPHDISPDEQRRINLSQMQESIQKSIFVALTHLGYEASYTGEGVNVVGIVEGSPAVGILREDDVIVGLNGADVALSTDLLSELGKFRPGDQVTLTVDRFNPDGDDQRLDLVVTLGTNPDDDSRPFIGVFIETLNLTWEFPIDVTINSQNIGGPSAGLMYTLSIIDLLTPEDLTKGHQIAGTGTIEVDGEVGAIGGVRQKVYGARRAGAAYVIIPAGNYEEALPAAEGEIELVPVNTLEEALAFLDSLEPVGAFTAAG